MSTPNILMPFNPTTIIKEIGRGKEGARSLSRETARELMRHMLAGDIEPLPLGAILMAYRIKGETPDELAGFLDAIHASLPIISGSVTSPIGSAVSSANPPPSAAFQPFATVVIPSYNGARKASASRNLRPASAVGTTVIRCDRSSGAAFHSAHR